jgi:hypothetical protein
MLNVCCGDERTYKERLGDEERLGPSSSSVFAAAPAAATGADPNPSPPGLVDIPGWLGGLIVAVLYIGICWLLRIFVLPGLALIEPISFTWLAWQILTFVWEAVFATFGFPTTSAYAQYLIEAKKHVWSERYGLAVILPWNTAMVYFSEYGAWADRKYGSPNELINLNSRFNFELTHGIVAGGFSLLSLIFEALYMPALAGVMIPIAMSGQVMNNVIYSLQCERAGRARLSSPRLSPPSTRGGRLVMIRARPPRTWLQIFSTCASPAT